MILTQPTGGRKLNMNFNARGKSFKKVKLSIFFYIFGSANPHSDSCKNLSLNLKAKVQLSK